MSADENAITGLCFAGQKHIAAISDKASTEMHLPVFAMAEKWLGIYFSGNNPGFMPPIKTAGTAFQETVWQILPGIPYGKTMSYGEIAKIIAVQKGIAKMSAQAAGAAVAHNPIALIIPCHRVIGKDGSLTGYAGGLHIKARLLELEKASFNP